ncbi:hypothetical protein JCM10296v2_003330 [Rhodotorula toruloides]
MDLFFCSPEHQRLVWPGHRYFCGSNAFPIVFPLLSHAEAATAIENLRMRCVPESPLTRLELLKHRMGRGELLDQEVIRLIRQACIGATTSDIDLATEMWQTLLVYTRVSGKTDTASFRDYLIGVAAKLYKKLEPQRVFGSSTSFSIPNDCDKDAAQTFHHIVVHSTLDAIRICRSAYPELDSHPDITVEDSRRSATYY